MQTRQKQCCSISQNSSIHLHLFRSAKPPFLSPTQSGTLVFTYTRIFYERTHQFHLQNCFPANPKYWYYSPLPHWWYHSNPSCFSRPLTHWPLQLSLGWSPSVLGRQTLESKTVQPFFKSMHRHMFTSLQYSDIFAGCSSELEFPIILYASFSTPLPPPPCLSLWPTTSVFSFSISSPQCRHPPPQNSTL